MQQPGSSSGPGCFFGVGSLVFGLCLDGRLVLGSQFLFLNIEIIHGLFELLFRHVFGWHAGVLLDLLGLRFAELIGRAADQ